MARPKVELSAEDRRAVLAARDAVRRADRAYVQLLRRMAGRYTQAAVARTLDVSPQALNGLLKRR